LFNSALPGTPASRIVFKSGKQGSIKGNEHEEEGQNFHGGKRIGGARRTA
jgi:hypothetical protein